MSLECETPKRLHIHGLGQIWMESIELKAFRHFSINYPYSMHESRCTRQLVHSREKLLADICLCISYQVTIDYISLSLRSLLSWKICATGIVYDQSNKLKILQAAISFNVLTQCFQLVPFLLQLIDVTTVMMFTIFFTQLVKRFNSALSTRFNEYTFLKTFFLSQQTVQAFYKSLPERNFFFKISAFYSKRSERAESVSSNYTICVNLLRSYSLRLYSLFSKVCLETVYVSVGQCSFIDTTVEQICETGSDPKAFSQDQVIKSIGCNIQSSLCLATAENDSDQTTFRPLSI